jgi:hypothetical protein
MTVLHNSPSSAVEILAILNAAFCQVNTEATSRDKYNLLYTVHL